MRNKKLNDMLGHMREILDTSLQDNEEQLIQDEDGYVVKDFNDTTEKKEPVNKKSKITPPPQMFHVKVFKINPDNTVNETYVCVSTSREYVKNYIQQLKDNAGDDVTNFYVCDYFDNILYEIELIKFIG